MDPFRSKRLLYGSYESPDHDEFFYKLQSDPVAFINASTSLVRPTDRRLIDKIRTFMLDRTLLFTVIQKLPEKQQETTDKAGEAEGSQYDKPIPIGIIFLKSPSPDMAQHRCAEMGVDIMKEYQGCGYGTEAINWTLDWAFKFGGLNRVELAVMGWNPRAGQLYEKLGFREEGRRRESLFKDDKFWDEIHMGILKREWQQMRQQAPN